MLIAGYFTGKLKDETHIFAIPAINKKEGFLYGIEMPSLEQASWSADSVPAAELLSPDSPSYLPNCSLGLAIVTCASSSYSSRE